LLVGTGAAKSYNNKTGPVFWSVILFFPYCYMYCTAVVIMIKPLPTYWKEALSDAAVHLFKFLCLFVCCQQRSSNV